MDSIQCSKRISREGVKSDATVKIFYGKVGVDEVRLRTSMNVKSNVLRNMLDENASKTRVLPDQYESYVENVDVGF